MMENYLELPSNQQYRIFLETDWELKDSFLTVLLII